VPDVTFTSPDLTTFCRLEELGLEAVGQRLDSDRAVLACRVVAPDQWCRRCGCGGAGAGRRGRRRHRRPGHRDRRPKASFADAVARLDAIPGIGPTVAAVIIAEVGLDMTRFPAPAHCARGRGSRPGSNPRPQDQGQRRHRPRELLPRPRPRRGRRSASGGPAHSSTPATDGSSVAVARRGPPSPSADRSWSSSGTCSPTPTCASTSSAPTTTTDRSTPTPGGATTSANSKPSATRSPSNLQPDPTPWPSPCLVTFIFGLAAAWRTYLTLSGHRAGPGSPRPAPPGSPREEGAGAVTVVMVRS
jgi:Transposase IS116/IS110/IS902 family